MRRKRSDELPRYVSESESPSFKLPRRSRIYTALGLLLLYFIVQSNRKRITEDDGIIHINWSSFAYSLYATDSATLCHAVLIFDALAKFGSKADRVLFYPDYWDTEIRDSKDRDSQLLVIARDKYKVKLQPIQLLSVEGRTQDERALWTGTWDKSVTKFMAFSLAYYDRVVALDSDITLLQSLDELFFLPSTPIAMPRAYWYDTRPRPLTSLLMVIKPDLDEFAKFKKIIKDGASDELVRANKFDMELLNDRFADSAMVLPHRPFALLTGEFRRHNHSEYLGSLDAKWDAEKVYNEAKLIHFSDWPLPKPWIMWPYEGLAEIQPDCGGSQDGTCQERQIWKGLYEDFRQRRKDICKLLSVPAPEWRKIRGGQDPLNEIEGAHDDAPQDGSASITG